MSLRPVTDSLEKLIILHKSLLEVSKQKTDIVKEGSAEKLQSLLVKERKHVQALEQAEAKRQQVVGGWLKHQGIQSDEATLTDILNNVIDQQDKRELEAAAVELTNVITQLKQQEQLNQALIRQSMQFVELSLETMKPSIQSFNYGGNKTSAPGRSVFDSRA
ncbi:flagellar protein FlgN [Virgibacillus kekensis]|uniref:Flagellar protein FlgN n=1 Tax=Virgibacillus kekensis TaxID=202261 RepID=A0ABV9DFJ1_9BACI